MTKRICLDIRGAVQGVGFRPFVYGLATRLGLAGFVLNQPQGVEVELEGTEENIQAFLAALDRSPPPLARIQAVDSRDIAPLNESTFSIRESADAGERVVLIAPDMATCSDCLRELADPDDRRYRYPFINCTNCGPRYTIIRDLPYDRAKTTMSGFQMCPECQAEYEDPGNRRFHAEPTCCPVCGPQVRLTDASGAIIPCDDPVADAVRRLEGGEILAVKGLGGFHLACDASRPEAVRELRRRKHRDLKPFAIMVRDRSAAARVCELLPGTLGQGPGVPIGAQTDVRAVLEGGERPILLMTKRPDHGLADEVAPRSASFGVMLPYTPLHHLLMEGRYPALVMTSGNLTDEPIAHTNDDALHRLSDIADAFLLHDRGIHIRTDDSVARIIHGQLSFLRRSRGYAPFPVALPVETSGGEIVAMGAELNNTVCVTRAGQAFLSHHVGDLRNMPAYEAFLQAIDHLQEMLVVEPGIVACDLHPDYLSTRYARERGLRLEWVQHHHAHVASVLAEHDRTDKVIGVSFDGMGWGEDASPWGGEFMVCDLGGFERVGHLEPVPQPGGDAAAKETPRMAYAFLLAAFGNEADDMARQLLPSFSERDRTLVAQLIDHGVNCPLTSSVGRLFDAAGALLGICNRNTYHSQAPMELEAQAAQAGDDEEFYPADVENTGPGQVVLRTTSIVRGLVKDRLQGTPVSHCAARFHNSLARATLDICLRIRNNTGLAAVGLSGGVFANAFLVERLVPLLEREALEVLLNAAVPPGDGGVCLGQAAVAAWRNQCA